VAITALKTLGPSGRSGETARVQVPMFTRSRMLPLVRPAEMDEPANCAPNVAGVRPGPRKAEPAAESVTEKGVPIEK